MKKKTKANGRRKWRSGVNIPAKRARRVKTLQRYLRAYGGGSEGRGLREQFAKRVGTTLPYLIHLAWGFRLASTTLAMKIEQATYGQVSLEDLRPDMNWAYLAARKARAAHAAA